MWRYSQTTGELHDSEGKKLAVGYAGNGEGKNNHAMQHVPNVGPLPCGFYTIEFVGNTTTHGPYVLRLVPDKENEMFGRSGFLCHGDSRKKPGSASLGCIIQNILTRKRMWESMDHRIEVVK